MSRKSKNSSLTLKLDPLDHEAVMQAIAYRGKHPLPDHTSNTVGAVIAEICRGWLEMLGEWNWTCGTGKPTRECQERGGPEAVLKIHRGAGDGAKETT